MKFDRFVLIFRTDRGIYMKNKLHLLFTATALMTPSVFGAISEAVFEDHHVAASSKSIVEIASRAIEFRREGNLEAAARVYAGYAMRHDAGLFNVVYAARMIEKLGCFSEAINVLEWSKIHPATRYFKETADAEINRLSQLKNEQTGTSSKPTAVSTGRPSVDLSVATGAGAMVALSAAPSAVENKGRYTRMYSTLQERWKIAVAVEEDLKRFFFDKGIDNSELMSTAMLELMYGFLIEHPEIYISDLENFGLFTVAEYNTAMRAVTIPQIQQLKSKLLDQSLAAFEKGQALYATIVQVGGTRSGHYTVVVIERNGKVHMINTMGVIAKRLEADDPYVYIMPELVKALNTHKGFAPIVFTAASNVRTGIQDADAGSNSCGIYSFVYWAALMMTQDMNAYKRVTAAASDGYLGGYEDIVRAATLKKEMGEIVQIDDKSKANEFGIQYFKNPSAEVQGSFEREVRERLQLKLTEFVQ